MKLTNENLISINQKFKTQDEVLKHIGKLVSKYDSNITINEIYKGLVKREKQISTAVGDGIAIPHTIVDKLKEPLVIVIENSDPLDWKADDKNPVTTVISIIVPKQKQNMHLDILSTIASKLLDEKTISNFKKFSAKEIEEFINMDIKEDPKVVPKVGESKPSKEVKVVGISTCPVGIAHTFMAAEALEKYGAEHNISVKIEKQAAIGIKDELSQKEIEEADYVIIAAGKAIEGRERFVGKKGIEVPVKDAFKRTKEVFEEAEKSNEYIFEPIDLTKAKGEEVKVKASGKNHKVSPMAHILAGLSYMIPFVVVGGLLIAFSMGIGYEIPKDGGGMVPKNSFWAAMNFVGVQAFVLMIPILAGFTANSIAGRSAIAPAMIIAFMVNDGGGAALWNYENGEFGGFTDSAGLGFLGAIAAGYLVGYSTKWFNGKFEAPKWLAPAMPIMVIPLLFTVVFWVFFAFIGYLPLYYLALSLNNGLKAMVDKGLLPLAALILGAMMAFDMGGPINKIAFFFGVMFISTEPTIMGAVGAAGPIPPLTVCVGVFAGKKLGIRFDESDETDAGSAGLMGLIGISEGAIPLALKYPKAVFPAIMTGGATAAFVASLFKVTNVAAHTGPIVYALGAVGKENAVGQAVTNYGYGLWFMFAILVGTLLGAALMILSLKITQAREDEGLKQKINKLCFIKEQFQTLKTKISKKNVNKYVVDETLKNYEVLNQYYNSYQRLIPLD